METKLQWVSCEACGGTGEIIRRELGGHTYAEPIEYAELCAACDGTGRDCAEADIGNPISGVRR